MSQEIVSIHQLVGYVALLIYLVGYTFKTDNGLKVIFSISNVFWMVHYHMINADTAMLTTFIITARNLFSLNSPDFSPKRRLLTAWIFSGLLMIAGFITWAGWISLIPVTACIFVTFGMIYLKGIPLRGALLLADIGWLLHSYIVVSISGFIYAGSALIVNGRTMYVMRKGQPRRIND